ncbi:MAG: undecaprenyl-phosphate glucose phosphotransferase [Hyphomicrobiales bacterium]
MRNQEPTKQALASAEVVASLDAGTDGREIVPAVKTADPKEDGWISPSIVLGSVRTLEALVIALVGFDIWAIYVSDGIMAGLAQYAGPILILAGVVPIVFQAFGLYTIHSLLRVAEQAARVVMAWTAVFAVFTAVVFFTKLGDVYSRVWLLSWYTIGVAALISLRFLVCGLVRKWNTDGRLDRAAVIVGGGPRTAELIDALEGSPDTDVSIVGIFDDRSDHRSPATINGYPKLGDLSQLVEFARNRRVDMLIVSLPITAENRLLEVLRKLWVLPVDIRLSAHTNRLRFRPRAYSFIGSVPFFDVFDKPLSGWDSIIKDAEDRFVSAAALVLAAPVMALVALAIKLDSRGPVFFKQKRYGFNNELIEVYKFRSMYIDQADASASKLVTKDDPRVTRVGRFIRKTSLDELPQLFNVLKGDLSLVGPRPHATMAKAADRLYTDVVDGYFARHKVKPGITGWAQIRGWRGETDTTVKIERRVEHDLYYIENWSVMFDLYILCMTPYALLNTENAY